METSALLLKPEQVAHSLGISRAQVYSLLRAGGLPWIVLGRARRIPAAALAEWVRQNTKECPSVDDGSPGHVPDLTQENR